VKELKEVKKIWKEVIEGRTILLEESTIPELEEKATKIREVLIEVLNWKARKLRVCAISKWWWNQTMKKNRRIFGFGKRERRAGRSNKARCEQARKDF
jgi:hypothetical protein